MRGILAGLVAGTTMLLGLIALDVGVAHRPLIALLQFPAAAAIGKTAAYANPSTLWLGIALHYAVSVLWAIGYGYLAQTTPQLARRPLLSGLVFGFVVLIAMQLVEIGANVYALPRDNFELGTLIVSHLVFYGLPVAWVVAARSRARVPS